MKIHTILALLSLLALIGETNADAAAKATEGKQSFPNWIFQQELHAYDSFPNDAFGQSVMIENETVVVGATRSYFYTEEGILLSTGSAYVFTRHKTSDEREVWSVAQKLVASDADQFDNFGEAVDIRGETIVVGAPYADHSGKYSIGAVYVFSLVERNASKAWIETQKITMPDSENIAYFGRSVAISENKIAVGEDRGNDEKGAAYVFMYNETIQAWSLDGQLTTAIGYPGDQLGRSVDVSGDTVVVGAPKGAPQYHIGNRNRTGYAVVFQKLENGEWDSGFLLIPTEGIDQEEFGDSVAIEGNTVVVGSEEATYIFERNEGSNLTWVERQRIRVDGAVAIDGDRILVNNHIFRRFPDGNFVKEGELEESVYSATDVGLSGQSIVLGTYDDAFVFVEAWK